jgi:hypothetical protein
MKGFYNLAPHKVYTMFRWYFLSFIAACTFLFQPITVYASAEQPSPLFLLGSLTLKYDSPLQPSGLSICQNHLLMISDNQDFSIYALHPSDRNNALSLFRKITVTPPALPSSLPWKNTIQTKLGKLLSTKTYDWEAITCDHKGNIYLASEAFFNIAKIDASGNAQWLIHGLYERGDKDGFFNVHNGGIEGLAWFGLDTLYIAAERNQRGIIKAQFNEKKWRITNTHLIPDSRFTNYPERSQDLAGLWQEGDYIFTLERNNFLVCRRTLNDLDIETCWSYSHIENAPQFRYQDSHFGIAEGLARQGDKLYIVVDNNEKARVSSSTDKKDTQAMLMIYKLPEDWLPNDPTTADNQ